MTNPVLFCFFSLEILANSTPPARELVHRTRGPTPTRVLACCAFGLRPWDFVVIVVVIRVFVLLDIRIFVVVVVVVVVAARPWSYLVSAIKLIWRGAPQNKVRGSEATQCVFCLRTKKPSHGTVRTGFFYFIVCLIAYSSRIFAPLSARAVRY